MHRVTNIERDKLKGFNREYEEFEILKERFLSHYKNDNRSLSPSFEDDYRFYVENGSLYNGYAYALQLKVRMQSISKGIQTIVPGLIYNPGYLSGKYNCGDSYTPQSFIDGIKYDCDLLGIEYSSTDLKSKINKDEYMIIAMLEKNEYCEYLNRDFHFIRRNSDGSFSDKLGWSCEIRRANRKKIIKNNIERYEVIDILKLSMK